MARRARNQSKAPVLSKLRKTLQTLEETSLRASMDEAKEYICSVCDLPVKPCEANSSATCFHMLREGTELQALFVSEKESSRKCIVCGKTISKKSIVQDPEAELCATCRRKTTKSRTAPLRKGATI